jgi:hypothetical protein
MFTTHDYSLLSNLVFRDSYSGYRPNVIESPNGDGNWDTEKRYAHIAAKYLGNRNSSSRVLYEYLDRAHERSVEISIELGIPKAFWPKREYGAMRVLEYPPGSVTHPHVDFDLFTMMCYRNIKENFTYVGDKNDYWCPGLVRANELNDQIHFGEISELVIPYYKATPHEVIADHMDRTQYSIVYFSIPDHEAILPNGMTVGKWLEERMSRSRKDTI